MVKAGLAFILAPLLAFAQEVEQVKKTSFLGIELNLGTTVGAGAAIAAFQQHPVLSSSLFAYPFYKLPLGGERELKIQLEISGAVEWFGRQTSIVKSGLENVSVGDAKLRAELKKALYLPELGLSISPALKIEAPLSQSARYSNRIIGLGAYLNSQWAKSGFSLGYKPVILGYLYSLPYVSGICTKENIDDDKLSSGLCKISGRQTAWLIKNGVSLAYNFDVHTLSLGFRIYHSLLRTLNQSEKGASMADVLEATLFKMEYNYSFANAAIPTSVTVGLSGYQSFYDAKTPFRIPFFSLNEPQKNLIDAYVELNVAI